MNCHGQLFGSMVIHHKDNKKCFAGAVNNIFFYIKKNHTLLRLCLKSKVVSETWQLSIIAFALKICVTYHPTESRRLVPVINRGSQTAERAKTPAHNTTP